jgi:hypothetical protein
MNRSGLPIVLVVMAICLAAAFSARAGDASAPLLTAQSPSGELTGWKSFHEPAAKTGDVWTLAADGVLRSKGTPKGYLYTDRDYTNFVLSLDWRWPPGKKPGNGGVLLRMTGPNRIWPKSLEAQLNAGDAGDFWGLAGYRLTGPAERMKSLEHPQFGGLVNLKKLKPLEKEPGQWNHYEIRAEGQTVTLSINGELVNRATGCDAVPGKICLTAEGDQYEFRNVRLAPLDGER